MAPPPGVALLCYILFSCSQAAIRLTTLYTYLSNSPHAYAYITLQLSVMRGKTYFPGFYNFSNNWDICVDCWSTNVKLRKVLVYSTKMTCASLGQTFKNIIYFICISYCSNETGCTVLVHTCFSPLVLLRLFDKIIETNFGYIFICAWFWKT